MAEVLTSNAEQQGDVMTWEVRLGDQDPHKRWLALGIAMAAGLTGMAVLGNPVAGIVAFLIILGSATELFFPLRYKLDAEGASVRCGLSVSAIEWSKVQRVLEVTDGFKLSPLANPSRLEEFRGVFLRTPRNRETVLAKIRQFREYDA